MEQNFYKYSDNEEFVYRIDESLAINGGMNWKAMTDVLDQYQPAEVQSLSIHSILNCLPEYCEYLKACIHDYSKNVFWGYNERKSEKSFILDVLNRTSIFSGQHAFMAVFIEFAVAVGLWIRKKKIPWLHLGFGSFILSILCLTFLTAPGEFNRLTILVVPFLHILLPLYFDQIILKISERRRKSS